jgi:ethylmalonyl-CoA mutase
MPRDTPWIFRTYAGHSSALASNQLFHQNLAAGQNGLSIAFDLPTQCGYDPDHPMALAEVGKVGVPISSIDDIRVLFAGLPLEKMNTSMTINATAPWLLALYIALAQEQGVALSALRGTTQNDIIKEYLARGTYIFPPEPSLRMIAQTYEYCVANAPAWNPSNICSYHLQEAGATPVQEVAFALADAIGILDLIKSRGQLDPTGFAACVGRMSFFVNAGVRFIEEMCKLRAFAELWDEICVERYGIADPKLRQFRYGVQVNSLGLTEAQPENNAWRILLSSLAVTLSKNARCRALQLPAWNEALSLPRPWDQQWSLRLQQILAHETDLLEYGDLFEGNPIVATKTQQIVDGVRSELANIARQGGVATAVDSGYLKSELMRSMAARMRRIETGEQVVVGVNRWTDGLASPLQGSADGGQFVAPTGVAENALASLQKTRAQRDPSRVAVALSALKAAAVDGTSIMPPSIECAHARVTTGEWAATLREVFGEYRAATGIAGGAQARNDSSAESSSDKDPWRSLAERVSAWAAVTGSRPRILVGKPGLDGHSNGAEMIALAARDAGFEVIFAGIRSDASALAATAVQEGVDVIGLSVLSGSHLQLAQTVLDELAARGCRELPVVVGGIVPPEDRETLLAMGVRRVFTPSDFRLVDVISAVMDVVQQSAQATPRP